MPEACSQRPADACYAYSCTRVPSADSLAHYNNARAAHALGYIRLILRESTFFNFSKKIQRKNSFLKKVDIPAQVRVLYDKTGAFILEKTTRMRIHGPDIAKTGHRHPKRAELGVKGG